MKTTIYLTNKMKKDIKVQAVINEISTSIHINTIIKIYKNDILKMINENNELVRNIIDKKEAVATYDINDDTRKFCKEHKLKLRVVIICATYLYQEKHRQV